MRSKHYPYLNDYLATLVMREKKGLERLPGSLGVIGATVGFVSALWAAKLVLALQFFGGRGVIFGLVGIAFVVWMLTIGFSYVQRKRESKVTPREKLHRQAIQVAQSMLASKRLHKELNPVAGQLLDESARFWREIMSTLANPFWTSENLPSHWQSVRERTASAANQAMEEELILLQDSFFPTGKSMGLEDVVENVVETYITGPKPMRADRLPAAFDQVRAITEKLRIASVEISKATEELSRDETMQGSFHSGEALDLALGDLRTVREAETELRQTLRG